MRAGLILRKSKAFQRDQGPQVTSPILDGEIRDGRHHMQVRVLGWSPISPSGQQLAYGHIKMNCDVVVSGGLGCSIMPFRLGVPPEIVLVKLGGAGTPVA